MGQAVITEPGIREMIVRGVRRFFLNRRWISLLFVVGVWQLLTLVVDIDLFPTPLGVAEGMGEALQGWLFVSNLADSMLRIALGFGLGLIGGVVVGAVHGVLSQHPSQRQRDVPVLRSGRQDRTGAVDLVVNCPECGGHGRAEHPPDSPSHAVALHGLRGVVRGH